LAHELRNPLSAVSNASRLLDGAREEKTARRAREIIERQTANMVRMVDDLLDVSRVTYGKMRLQAAPSDLVAMVRHAIETTEPERATLAQALEAKLPEAALHVNADPVRIDQILTNVLSNASKFTPRGGKVWVEVEREASASRPVAAVRVRDNGSGIDPTLLPRIFDLFVQGDRPGDRARGFGLGLTLAKRLADLHGGSIEALSGGTGGSEFVIRLPLLAKAPQPAPKPRRRRAPAVTRTAYTG